jgi:hypothetical protein
MQLQGTIIGLLIAAIFVGSFDVAVRTYSAIGTHPQTETGEVKPVKFQDRLVAVLAASEKPIQATSIGAVKPLQTAEPSASNLGSDATGPFSVSNIQPTDGFVTAPAMRPASSKHPDPDSSPASQSGPAAGPHSVSLSIRKPKRPTAIRAAELKARTDKPKEKTDKPKAEADRPEEKGPTPLAFGSIGYNYNPQQN